MSIKLGTIVGQAVDPVTNEKIGLIYKRKSDIRGGFNRMGAEKRIQNFPYMRDTMTVHGYKLMFFILRMLDMTQWSTPIVVLTQKNLEEVIGREYPGNRACLYKGIKELLDISVIKHYPKGGKGTYYVNKNWFMTFTQNQESF